ncbi:biotin synthase BioB [Sphaerimonospora thailandensis]|uniref:biotin synthase BioB n=1 Tax=Sphaerimonospora thailandensis TaxID=795644 RepID=UPI001EF304E9|nr:radical SAM protein [Sphaerimonospora thailandensis]
MNDDILEIARVQVLEEGRGLDAAQALACLTLPDDRLPDLLALAHEVLMKWCGPEVEVEGIVSLKTGGCPEDCHFYSQSGQFTSPVRAAWLDIPSLVQAAVETAQTGATEFCIVAAVRGPDRRLMDQVREGVKAIREAVDINIACSLGILTQAQVDELAEMGVHRYNHNLETARSHFAKVVTTHTWEERCAAAASSAWARRWSSGPSSPRNSASWPPTRSRSTSSTPGRARRSPTSHCWRGPRR